MKERSLALAVDLRKAEAVADTGQPCVCNDDFLLVQEHISCVEPFVKDASGVEVAHPRRYLLHNVDRLLHWEWLAPDVKMFVESVASTKTGERGGEWWVWPGGMATSTW